MRAHSRGRMCTRLHVVCDCAREARCYHPMFSLATYFLNISCSPSCPALRLPPRLIARCCFSLFRAEHLRVAAMGSDSVSDSDHEDTRYLENAPSPSCSTSVIGARCCENHNIIIVALPTYMFVCPGKINPPPPWSSPCSRQHFTTGFAPFAR